MRDHDESHTALPVHLPHQVEDLLSRGDPLLSERASTRKHTANPAAAGNRFRNGDEFGLDRCYDGRTAAAPDKESDYQNGHDEQTAADDPFFELLRC